MTDDARRKQREILDLLLNSRRSKTAHVFNKDARKGMLQLACSLGVIDNDEYLRLGQSMNSKAGAI